MPAAAKRIYLVSNAGTDYLVRAQSQAQALSHVVRSTCEVRVASQDDLVVLAPTVKVEDAGAVA